jgi:hypothetical protein
MAFIQQSSLVQYLVIYTVVSELVFLGPILSSGLIGVLHIQYALLSCFLRPPRCWPRQGAATRCPELFCKGYE